MRDVNANPNGTSMKVIINAMFAQRQITEKIADQAIWVDDADAAVNELQSADAHICPDHFTAKIADAVGTILQTCDGFNYSPPAMTTRSNGFNASRSVQCRTACLRLRRMRCLLLAVQQRVPTVLSIKRGMHGTAPSHPGRTGVSTIVVVGFGAIGCEIGRMLHAMGADHRRHATACRSTR
jgi:phosphoglycerate dehydrogenase-like enzyme